MSNPLGRLRQWTLENTKNNINIVPCSVFKNEHIWHQSFPLLKTEAALTTYDANGDNILDVVVGFSTGIVM